MKLKDYLKGRDHFWVMHLTYDGDQGEELWKYARQHEKIGLDLWDFNRRWNDQTKAEKLRFYHTVSRMWYNQFEALCNRIEKDDLVVIIEGQKAILGIGRTTKEKGDYGYSPELKLEELFFDHTKDVSWDLVWDYDDPEKPIISAMPPFTCTLLRAPSGGKYWEALENIDMM